MDSAHGIGGDKIFILITFAMDMQDVNPLIKQMCDLFLYCLLATNLIA